MKSKVINSVNVQILAKPFNFLCQLVQLNKHSYFSKFWLTLSFWNFWIAPHSNVYALPCCFCLIYNFLLPAVQVLELGELIKTKQITSKELTRIFLQRLKR